MNEPRDWIILEPDDPAVLAMARKLGLNPAVTDEEFRVILHWRKEKLAGHAIFDDDDTSLATFRSLFDCFTTGVTRALLAKRRSNIPSGNLSMPYAEYLQTKHWQMVRQLLAPRRCDYCGKTGIPLDIHHLTYERIGRELRRDLVALCRQCHQEAHTE